MGYQVANSIVVIEILPLCNILSNGQINSYDVIMMNIIGKYFSFKISLHCFSFSNFNSIVS